VSEQQSIVNDLRFQSLATHLEPTQHASSDRDGNLGLEDVVREVVKHGVKARMLRSINTQHHPHAATLHEHREARVAGSVAERPVGLVTLGCRQRPRMRR